ncbi:aquaporin-9-like isoform X2 [Dermacentor albipictus]|uniref:aquaporin-9-like isoform X2 n=1 Tax=Dermacentor albipictus TaxID=60249 RepID=UPI0031FBC0F3
MKIENLLVRQLINEFLGTLVLILIGDSVLAVIIAGENESIAAVVGPLGWGVAIYVAVQIAGGVTAHLNPAVTLGLASVRKFPIAKVPLYFAAQYLGAFVGAALVFVTYKDCIEHFDQGVRAVVGKKATAAIFATYPREHVSTLTCFIDQVISTGILMLTAEAIGDPRNFGGIPVAMHPICLGLMIMALIFSFAYNCMCPLNPARDVGPRLFTLMAGWGPETFTLRGWNYVWVPVLGPHIGAILGAWLYKLAIADHWPDIKPKPTTSTNGESTTGRSRPADCWPMRKVSTSRVVGSHGKEAKEELVETLYKVDGDKLVIELEPTQHQKL